MYFLAPHKFIQAIFDFCYLDLYLGCRNPSGLDPILRKLKSGGSLGAGTYEILPVDLMSMDSVKSFAKDIATKNIPLNVLANNGTVYIFIKEVKLGRSGLSTWKYQFLYDH